METRARARLRTALKFLGLFCGLIVIYVLLDFAIDLRPASVQDSYRFDFSPLAEDEVRILRRDNLSILLIRRSAATLERLQSGTVDLQDPDSRRSEQPGYARNAWRSRQPEIFVSYAIGTDLGCALEVEGEELGEVCGDARYDFAGRAIAGGRQFRNLAIPDYNLNPEFTRLTVRP